MSYKERMKSALASLEAQLKPNFTATAEQYGLKRHVLSRQFQGKTTLKAEASSEYQKCLTTTQEKVLVDHITKLTRQALPPTSQMVKNLAEEIIRREVKKNWVGDFVKRQDKALVSMYLQNMDVKRLKSEYRPAYEYYFKIVSDFMM